MMLTGEALVEGWVVCIVAYPYGSILSIVPSEGRMRSVFLPQKLLSTETMVGQRITVVYDRETGLVRRVIL